MHALFFLACFYSGYVQQQGERLAKEIGAKYYECSAKNNQNVHEVISAATKIAMTGGIMRLQKRLCTLL